MNVPWSIWTGLATGVSVPSVCFAVQYITESRLVEKEEANGGKRWMTFTPPIRKRDGSGNVVKEDGSVDFAPRHGHYMKCGEVLVTLASASLVFIPNLHVNVILPSLGFPMVLLGFTVVYSLCFMGLITYYYEQFLYDPLSYGVFRSSVIYGLGFGALSCFAISYFTLSIIVANAACNGLLIAAKQR